MDTLSHASGNLQSTAVSPHKVMDFTHNGRILSKTDRPTQQNIVGGPANKIVAGNISHNSKTATTQQYISTPEHYHHFQNLIGKHDKD
jgi:hypothetical protein